MKTYEELYTEKDIQELAEMGIGVPAKESMSCYQCVDVETCKYAWDLYNQDDCLADK